MTLTDPDDLADIEKGDTFWKTDPFWKTPWRTIASEPLFMAIAEANYKHEEEEYLKQIKLEELADRVSTLHREAQEPDHHQQ